MAQTAVPNSPVITLQPTGVAGPTSLNPTFITADPTNGNYFVASGRDMITLFTLQSALAPTYNAANTYTIGQVVNVLGGSPPAPVAYIAIASVPVSTPPPNGTYWTLYTSSTVTIFSAPDACTGRLSNVINYPVPTIDATTQYPGSNNTGTVQFQILPSSVFTQTTGQVLFTASSNLVQVNVSSL